MWKTVKPLIRVSTMERFNVHSTYICVVIDIMHWHDALRCFTTLALSRRQRAVGGWWCVLYICLQLWTFERFQILWPDKDLGLKVLHLYRILSLRNVLVTTGLDVSVTAAHGLLGEPVFFCVPGQRRSMPSWRVLKKQTRWVQSCSAFLWLRCSFVKVITPVIKLWL